MELTVSRRTSWLLYLLSFVMVWQCVKPVTVLTILQSEAIFFIYIGVSLLIVFFRLPLLVSLPVHFMMILFSLHYFYFPDERLFSGAWIWTVGQDLYLNVGMLFRGNLFFLSDLFTTFILFILLWLITIAMSHWLKKTRSFLLFFFLALFTLSLLDSLTFYEADRSIVIVIAVGLLILGIQKYNQMKTNGEIEGSNRAKSYWFRIVAMLATGILLLGMIAPKPDAQWNMPLIQSLTVPGTGQGGGSLFAVGQRIGYDEDDTRLGGSLGMDTTKLFTVRTDGTGGYWRVESKSIYTGRGWIGRSDEQPQDLSEPYDRYPALSIYGSDTYKSDRTAEFNFESASPDILPYTGQLTGMQADDEQLSLDPSTGKIMSGGSNPVPHSTIHYQEPTFQIPKLRDVKDRYDDPAWVAEEHLQLPESLPERVRTLSRQIIGQETNRYDQANAVVDYLRSGRFDYSTTGVPKPSGRQDYVDQFLFESKIGYCDNFSTAMVVLLRASGIPARWVKGFSTGSLSDLSSEERDGKQVQMREYEVTNANAHSWVEVYFPDSGWVTFEPTPSFNNPGNFTSVAPGQQEGPADSGNDQSDEGETDGRQDETPEQPQTAEPDAENPQEQNAQDAGGSETEQQTTADGGSDQKKWIFVDPTVIRWTIAIFAAAAVLALILTWKRWMAGLYARRQKRIKIQDRRSFAKAYRNLLRLLTLKGIARADTQTLREYARTVDTKILDTCMVDLTRYYERVIYGDKQTSFNESERMELNQLMMKMIAHLRRSFSSQGAER